jgi:hypothetical protein
MVLLSIVKRKAYIVKNKKDNVSSKLENVMLSAIKTG